MARAVRRCIELLAAEWKEIAAGRTSGNAAAIKTSKGRPIDTRVSFLSNASGYMCAWCHDIRFLSAIRRRSAAREIWNIIRAVGAGIRSIAERMDIFRRADGDDVLRGGRRSYRLASTTTRVAIGKEHDHLLITRLRKWRTGGLGVPRQRVVRL